MWAAFVALWKEVTREPVASFDCHLLLLFSQIQKQNTSERAKVLREYREQSLHLSESDHAYLEHDDESTKEGMSPKVSKMKATPKKLTKQEQKKRRKERELKRARMEEIVAKEQLQKQRAIDAKVVEDRRQFIRDQIQLKILQLLEHWEARYLQSKPSLLINRGPVFGAQTMYNISFGERNVPERSPTISRFEADNCSQFEEEEEEEDDRMVGERPEETMAK